MPFEELVAELGDADADPLALGAVVGVTTGFVGVTTGVVATATGADEGGCKTGSAAR